MYVTVPYNKVLFSIVYCLTSQSEFDFGIALVHGSMHNKGHKSLQNLIKTLERKRRAIKLLQALALMKLPQRTVW
jgi:hypothetical protein